jgi:hypothetical protein
MDCETGSARMVKAGGVDQQYVRRLIKGSNRARQQRAFPACEQAGPVGGRDPSGDQCLR